MPRLPALGDRPQIEAENGKLLASEDALEIELDEPRAGSCRAATPRIGHDGVAPDGARFRLDGEALYLQDAAFLAWATGWTEPPPNRADRAIDVLRVIARDLRLDPRRRQVGRDGGMKRAVVSPRLLLSAPAR